MVTLAASIFVISARYLSPVIRSLLVFLPFSMEEGINPMIENYTDINAKAIDAWVENGWEWSV